MCALAGAGAVAGAQDPSHRYLSIATRHFRITFTEPMTPLARRIAADAERAYVQLSNELHPPRGVIDILVSDDADFSNGSATPYPSNRIIVYATPPVNEIGLRFTTDWAQLVVTHELTHIFHLDRSRGIWQLGQHLFGRSPFLFPNLYSPSWLIEGIAVYEESRLAGEGRIEAPEHTMLARAAAADHRFPAIGQASLALPTFPFGNSAYAYGSLFVDFLARSHGDTSIRKFVEASSAQLPIIDYLIDIPAKEAFGTTFERAWGEWRKSIEATLPPTNTGREPLPSPHWRDLTTDGVAVASPRWVGDTSLTYSGTGGKDVYSEFAVSLDGRRTRGTRRNGPSPTVRLPDGSSLFSQLDLTGQYTERSDLFVERLGVQRRLTTGQRLFSPDARPDGSIVAEQIVDGTSRLVRLSRDGTNISPITSSNLDTLWSEPRWSNAGDRIVAVRWFRGGVSQVVVIDTLGIVRHVAMSGRFTAAAPSWIPDDSGIVFTIGDGGRNDIYLQYFHATQVGRPPAATGGFVGPSYAAETFRVNRSDFGAFEPQVSNPRGSNPSIMAAVALRANGYHLGVAEQFLLNRDVQTLVLDASPDPRLPALAVDSSPATPYSAMRTLFPRYWVPLVEAGLGDSYRLGGYTEGWDVLRRHYVYADLLVPLNGTGLVGSMQYEYRGLGLPILSTTATQDWARLGSIFSSATPALFLGEVRRRTRTGELLATFARPRVRNSFTVTLGTAIERREYATAPDSLMAGISGSGQFVAANFPSVSLSSTFAAYQSAPFSVSPEDGGTIGVTVRERTRSGFTGNGGPSTSVVTAGSLYKSLNLPGYAHHVLALRGSAGWADTRAAGYFDVGGTSGGTFQVISGYTIGEGHQTFPVRGFEAGTQRGIRAIGGSAEYRLPLSLPHRTVGVLPFFLNRTSVTVFGDYGMAWCPSTITTRQVCTDSLFEQRREMASVGAELNLNAGLLSWDSPYRFRIGVATPVRNGDAFGAKRITFYVTSGLSF